MKTYRIKKKRAAGQAPGGDSQGANIQERACELRQSICITITDKFVFSII